MEGAAMNIYRLQFACICPSDGAQIIYSLEIQSEKMIHVEHIVVAVALNAKEYHEPLADRLHQAFGGRQVITATHQGVQVETRRGFP